MNEKREDRLEAIRKRIKDFPAGPGLYFMKDCADKVLYIGKAKNLRSRVSSYFQPSGDAAASRGPKIAEMLNKTRTVDFLETDNEVEAVLKEARLIKDIRPPYNTDLIDDKSFPYLEITTSDDFPAVDVTRKPRSKGSRLFGPFTSANDLRRVVVELQRIFKFRTCGLQISEKDAKRRFFRPCLLYSIKQCTAPCADRIAKNDYKKIIGDLIRFLRSKRSVILRQLKREMEGAAEKLEFEKAAMLRDRMGLIERLASRGEPDEDVQPEVFATEPAEALERLQRLLEEKNPIRIIEGIDVAHISGSEAVGSLVKFIDGRPFKAGYRRFRIKTVKGIDDCAMIAEVVRRRYKYALIGEELWPDVILIDGGLGQLHAAEKALEELQKMDTASLKLRRAGNGGQRTDTKIIALAKREEEIYIEGMNNPVRLSRNNPALKLLQYVRDEAHRFAQHYHHILRGKKLLNRTTYPRDFQKNHLCKGRR
jgi:excinuclease ABC subunit C